MTLQILGYTVAALLTAGGLVGTVMPVVPGLPLMFLGMLIAAWIGHFAHIGVLTLVMLGLLTLLALVLDFVATALGAKKVGASKKAIIGASAGTIVGIFFGIWGMFLGPFIGAALGELQQQGGLKHAARVGMGTWMGLLFGTVLKLALACTMLAVFAFAWFV